MKKKILTIIIPTKNRFFFLKKLILEIKNFTNLIDIIVIDDCSGKKEKIKLRNFFSELNKIKFFEFKKNKGQSFSCNFGLKNCNTKYVWFFDDDDFLNKQTLKNILNHLKNNNPDAILLPMKQVFKNKTLKYSIPKKADHKYEVLVNQQQKVSTSCAIFDRIKINKIKGWDENLFGGTDTDLFLRFAQKNIFETLKVKPIIVNFASPERLSNKFLRQQKAKLYFLAKHWRILTLKRIFYYIISFILCFPLINSLIYRFKISNFNDSKP